MSMRQVTSILAPSKFRNTPSRLYFKQRGLSLIELMVSILISGMILAGVVQMYATTVGNSRASEGLSRIQENSRFVFSRLADDVVQAGSGGCMNLAAATEQSRIANVLNVDAGENEKYDMRLPLNGTVADGANSTDTLVLRFADNSRKILVEDYQYNLGADQAVLTLDLNDDDLTELTQFQVVYAGNCARLAGFMITNNPAGGNQITVDANVAATNGPFLGQQNANADLALGNDFGFASPADVTGSSSLSYLYAGDSIIEYRVDTSTNAIDRGEQCDVDSPNNCALYRNELELAEGIDSFEIEYGVRDDNGDVTYIDPDDNSDLDGVDWVSVDRIRVTANFNSIESSQTIDGNQYLDKTLSKVFMLRNQLQVF